MQCYKRDQPVFPNTLIYLWQPDAISTLTATNIHRPLPAAPASHTHEHDFSHIFSNFQTLLAPFFHKRYILTNLATFLDKPWFSWKMSPVLPREREVWLSRHNVASLSVCSVQWAEEKQRTQLPIPRACERSGAGSVAVIFPSEWRAPFWRFRSACSISSALLAQPKMPFDNLLVRESVE